VKSTPFDVTRTSTVIDVGKEMELLSAVEGIMLTAGGVSHSSSDDDSHRAGTADSDPNWHARSLVLGMWSPRTRTWLPPEAGPDSGLIDVTSKAET
jgi:hypothetical protein